MLWLLRLLEGGYSEICAGRSVPCDIGAQQLGVLLGVDAITGGLPYPPFQSGHSLSKPMLLQSALQFGKGPFPY